MRKINPGIAIIGSVIIASAAATATTYMVLNSNNDTKADHQPIESYYENTNRKKGDVIDKADLHYLSASKNFSKIGMNGDFSLYFTNIPSISEVRFDGGDIFYITKDGRFAFKGDLLDLEKGINETEYSRQIQSIKESSSLTSLYNKGNPSPNDAIDFKKLAKDSPHNTENIKEEDILNAFRKHETNSEASSYLYDQNRSSTSSDNVEELKRYRDKIIKRISSNMARVNVGAQESKLSSSTPRGPNLGKNLINLEEMQDGDGFVNYKGKKQNKIGFDKDGNKLSAEETKIQVINTYNRISSFGDKWSVVYPAKGDEKMGLMIFSDPTCPICQSLHRVIPDLNEKGIKVTILMYPRALGVEQSNPQLAASALSTLNSIWCTPDPAKTMDLVYRGSSVNYSDCSILKEQKRTVLPAYEHYFLGKLFGITGTPLMFTSEGDVLKGYSRNIDNLIHRIGYNDIEGIDESSKDYDGIEPDQSEIDLKIDLK